MNRGKLTLVVNGFNGMACSNPNIKDVGFGSGEREHVGTKEVWCPIPADVSAGEVKHSCENIIEVDRRGHGFDSSNLPLHSADTVCSGRLIGMTPTVVSHHHGLSQADG